MNEQGEQVRAVVAEHTPGPFTVGGLDDGTLIIQSEHEPDALAELPYGGPAYEPRQRANAHLFAAAPDLLAACEALSARMDSFCRSGIVPDHLDKRAMEQARAAIAKAKGGAS